MLVEVGKIVKLVRDDSLGNGGVVVDCICFVIFVLL